MFKQFLLTAARQQPDGIWRCRRDVCYRSTNSQVASILAKIGKPVDGLTAEVVFLNTRLPGIPAEFRQTTLAELVGYPWDVPQRQTIYVTADELAAAQAGRLPNVWLDRPLGVCASPVVFDLTPRHAAGDFLEVVGQQLRQLVNNEINEYRQVRVVVALIE